MKTISAKKLSLSELNQVVGGMDCPPDQIAGAAAASPAVAAAPIPAMVPAPTSAVMDVSSAVAATGASPAPASAMSVGG